MLSITGRPWKDTCDGLTRRELLRVGGASLLGLSLSNILRLEKAMAFDRTAALKSARVSKRS